MGFIKWLIFAIIAFLIIFLPWLFLYGLDKFLWG